MQVRAANSCSRYLDDGVGLVDDGWLGEVDDADAVGVSLPDDGAHCGVHGGCVGEGHVGCGR